MHPKLHPSPMAVIAAAMLCSVAVSLSNPADPARPANDAAGGAAPAPAKVATPPAFSNPLEITNPFYAVAPGTVKIYRGKLDGERAASTDLHLSDTRTVPWGGGQVQLRIVREVEFESGELVEVSNNFLAQSDDGAVYCFGEISAEYEDGVVVSYEGSWLVGGPTGEDPPETLTATEPTMFMPAEPQIGDQWKPENLPPTEVETVTVEKFIKKLKVEAGVFKHVMQVKEKHTGEPGVERKWYVTGVGLVRIQETGGTLELIATTLSPPADEL